MRMILAPLPTSSRGQPIEKFALGAKFGSGSEAALRGGLRDMAGALAHERRALRPHCPVNRPFLHRARAGEGAGA
jgi:hypothetical protein